ncbi:MAG: NusG domain II-containing protein [Faecousia sp.]
MIKTRTWIIGILLALLLFAGTALWLHGRSASGMAANIYQDGVCIRSIDLSQVTAAETYTVESDAGTNVILIEPGRICILEADCPDQVCVHAGWLTDSAAPIVCLPHRLVIRLEKTTVESILPEQADPDQIDAVSQ